MMLIEAMVRAPWASLTEPDSTVLHRVNVEGLPIKTWESATTSTACCGAKVKLIDAEWRDLRTRGTKYRRCVECRQVRPR